LVGTVVRAGVVGFVADGFVRVGAGELRSKEESVKIEESRWNEGGSGVETGRRKRMKKKTHFVLDLVDYATLPLHVMRTQTHLKASRRAGRKGSDGKEEKDEES
jgi:hypothetical protein